MTKRCTLRAVMPPGRLRRCFANGFALERLSYANTFLFPLALLKRTTEWMLPKGDASSDLSLDAGGLNGALKAILSAEAPLVAHGRLPFGLSIMAVGRKESAG